MFEDNCSNNSSGRAITDLVDVLRDAPLDGQPVDREITSDGTEIVLTNDSR